MNKPNFIVFFVCSCSSDSIAVCITEECCSPWVLFFDKFVKKQKTKKIEDKENNHHV